MSLLNNQLADLTRDLSKKNQELKMANARIQKIMDTDPLTGLLNRRSFRKILKKNMFFARRHNFPLALLMVDIDHFKKINDTLGHDVGDQVLKQLAKILHRSCRTEDIVARFGGEEFVVLLPGTNASSAVAWAERVRAKIENARIRRVSWKVTASFGVTELLPSDTEQSFIQRADEALYAAKRKGRNCCVAIQEIDGDRL
jgi:diguanylate cyclase (GGDEF)-like protein